MPLLIFDCDGVLVDSETISCTVLAELLGAHGYATTAAEMMREFGGRRLADVMRRAEELVGRPIAPEAAQAAGRELFARFRRELMPVAGAAQAIAALPYRRCVASSSVPERIKLSLDVTGLAPLFGDHVFSATEVANGKPAPDLFLFAAARMGEAAADAIVIEDSARGIIAARAAGMAAIGFSGGSHATAELAGELTAAGAECVITTMAELPAAVETVIGRT